MADQKISQLSDGGASQATDEYVIARSGANYRIDGASIAAAATSVGTLTSLTVSGDLTVDTSTLKVDSANNRVGIGTSSPAALLHLKAPTNPVIQFEEASGSGFIDYNATRLQLHGGGGSMYFVTGNAERMRLDVSGNLGINCTADSKLRVLGATAGTGPASLRIGFADTSVNYFDADTQYFRKGDSTNTMTLDASGNVGLGVTPSAWGGGGKAFEVGALGNGLQGRNTQFMTLTQNAYYDALAQYIYGSNGLASRYDQDAGAHKWFTAASGTAGNAITFTQAMTLDASGNLGVGTTANANTRLHVAFASATNDASVLIQQQTNGTAATLTIAGNNDGGAAYNYLRSTTTGGTEHWRISGEGAASTFAIRTGGTERARIDASGNLGIGTTSTTERLRVESSDTYQFSLKNSGGGVLAAFGVNTSSDLLFNVNGSERARITSGGSMVVGTAAIATTATDGFLYVPTCAGTPTGTPTTQTGTAPIVVDTTNNKLYFYSGGSWRDAGP